MSQANFAFSEDDLFIGKKLADGCYKSHCGYEFSKQSLSMSNNMNDEKMYNYFNSTKDEYWEKIRGFDDVTLKLYFKALNEFCNYLGYD